MLFKILMIAAVFSCCNCQLGELCANILDDVKACAAKYVDTISDLSGWFTDGESALNLEKMMTNELNVLCRNSKPLKNFYRCFYNKFLACIPSEWVKALPSIERTVDSITYLCNNLNDVDAPCIASNVHTVPQCVAAAVSKMSRPDVSSADGYISLMCRAYPITESCYKGALSVCPQRTSEVFTQYIKYQIPAACDASMLRFSLALLIISLCYTWLKKMI